MRRCTHANDRSLVSLHEKGKAVMARRSGCPSSEPHGPGEARVMRGQQPALRCCRSICFPKVQPTRPCSPGIRCRAAARAEPTVSDGRGQLEGRSVKRRLPFAFRVGIGRRRCCLRAHRPLHGCPARHRGLVGHHGCALQSDRRSDRRQGDARAVVRRGAAAAAGHAVVGGAAIRREGVRNEGASPLPPILAPLGVGVGARGEQQGEAWRL